MRSKGLARLLADVTAYQWGMVTTAQASTLDITRVELSRLVDGGHLKRLAHGVYKDSGAPGDQFDDLRAAWLSTDPTKRGEERIQDRANGVVIAGVSAAQLHDIGDVWASRHEFVAPRRRQSQRTEIRYRRRILDPRDVTLVGGLPAMTMERTIADLVDEVGDLSLVADALRDAARKGSPDLHRLGELLAPLAGRHGLPKDDGLAFLDRLMEIAGMDADAALGPRVAERFFSDLSKAGIDRLMMAPEMQETMRLLREKIAATLHHALAPQTAQLGATIHAGLKESPGVDELARTISKQLTNSDVMTAVTRAYGKTLSNAIALNRGMLNGTHQAQRTRAND